MKKVTNKQLQMVIKLRQKKYRDEFGLFAASGYNTVETCLETENTAYQLLIREDNIHLLDTLNITNNTEILILTEEQFKRISDEKTPQGIALILPQKKPHIKTDVPKAKTIVYLDRINDPGNMGTIIRSALWFGIDTIFLSPNSIDPFHPKVVRAGVGYTTLATIYENISYSQLSSFLSKNDYLLCVTLLKEGHSIKSFKPKGKTILAFGSEAHGISNEIYNRADFKLTIHKQGKGESLNLSAAASIFFYHWSNC